MYKRSIKFVKMKLKMTDCLFFQTTAGNLFMLLNLQAAFSCWSVMAEGTMILSGYVSQILNFNWISKK